MHSRHAREREHSGGLVAEGRSEAEILAAYPYLESADIRAALAYAAWRSEERDVPLTST